MLLSSSIHPHWNSRGLLSLPCRGIQGAAGDSSHQSYVKPHWPLESVAGRVPTPNSTKRPPNPSSVQVEGAVLFLLTPCLTKTTWEVKRRNA